MPSCTPFITDYTPFGMRMWDRSSNSSDYKYGFNGMEKDDELKGEGNSYDFGARIYDPRVGRWFSPDPYEKLYVPISPYTFALNSPIKFLDEDGNIVVDENGNPVTINVYENDDGSYCAVFDFVDGTSEAVKDKFLDNGGRAIKTAIQIQTGRESVEKAINSSELIHYTISSKVHKTVKKEKGKTTTSYRLGETKIGRIYEYDKSGKKIGIKAYTEEVTIYEGTIDAVINEKPAGDRAAGLGKEERIGTTLVHENEHATDVTEVKNRKAGQSNLNEPNHNNVRAVEDKAIKEYKSK